MYLPFLLECTIIKKKMKKQSKIYEFDPVIYPTRLWAVKNPNVEEVGKLFYPMDSNGNVVDEFGDALNGDGIYANTIIVGHKETFIRGCLISIFRPSQCGAGVCAHEALHYLAFMSEQFGIPLGDFGTSEPLAYLEQWATNCIWSVLTDKPEQMNGKQIIIKEEEK